MLRRDGDPTTGCAAALLVLLAAWCALLGFLDLVKAAVDWLVR